MKGTITIAGAGVDKAVKKVDERNKQVTVHQLLTGCISEINETQVNNSKDLEIIMQMYDLIEQ